MSAGSDAVLLVDDDEAVRNALKFSLELEGFDVRAYARPGAILAARDLPEQGCLVIDYCMPEMDGLALLDRLRERHVDLPAILIVSDHVGEKLRHQAERSGVQEILEKPLSDGALIASIRHAFVAPGRP